MSRCISSCILRNIKQKPWNWRLEDTDVGEDAGLLHVQGWCLIWKEVKTNAGCNLQDVFWPWQRSYDDQGLNQMEYCLWPLYLTNNGKKGRMTQYVSAVCKDVKIINWKTFFFLLMMNGIIFYVSHFKHIWHFLTVELVKMYMHTMIFTHMSYCCTTWSHTREDSEPNQVSLLTKTSTKSWILRATGCFLDVCLIDKLVNVLALPPLQHFIKRKPPIINTRALRRRGCCANRHRTKFGQMVNKFSL